MNKPKQAAGNPKKYFRIRDKILIAFLAVSMVSVGIISVFALQNMSVVGSTARANSIKLGETAVAESVAALEESGRKIIQLKAQVVARDFQIFFENNPTQSEEELLKTDVVRNIAIQPIGQTGYTMIYGYDNLIYLDINPKLIGTNIDDLTRNDPQFHDILQNGFKMESAGYYNQEDANGNIRVKYAYCVPIYGRGKYVVVATTYIDEFSRPAAETESRITAQVQAVTRYIDNQMDLAQWTYFFIIAAMLVLISILTTYVARSITNPIMALTRSVDVIAKGDLNHRITVKTGDEVELLADGFNTMTAALKESYANLEQKVKERTKELSQRAGQLHTINEISRKISSVINLDELLPLVTNLVKETFSYDNVNIFLFENSSGKMIIKEICLSGYKKVIPLDVPLELGEEGIVAWVAQTGEPLLANDVTKEPKYQFVEELSDTKSELAVPVKIGDKMLGVLDIESNEVDAFSATDLSTTQTLADQLAIAIENARLYQETSQIAVMEERNRIAREIHDTLAQGFTGIILQLEAAEQASEQGKNEFLISHLNRARSLARHSLNEARRSVWNLRPAALEKMKLPDAMKQEVDRFSKSNNIEASFNISGNEQELRPEIDTAILRIFQETLANIRKHAQATEVKIELNYDKEEVFLEIQDNGKGFPTEPVSSADGKPKGFGLISMRERAKNAGGTFEVESEIGQGTIIKVAIPIS